MCLFSVTSQKSQHDPPGKLQVPAAPTQVTSQANVRRSSISSVEEAPTTKNQTIQSPSPSATHVDTPTLSDITTCAANTQDGGESRIQVDPGERHSSSSPVVFAER